MQFSILIVDDEVHIRKGLFARLEYLNIHPKTLFESESGEDALEIIKSMRPDIVITDIRLLDMDGLTLIEKTRAAAIPAEFIILSGYAEFAYAEKAIEMGVAAYLLKPLSNEKLASALEDAVNALREKNAVREALLDKSRIARENISLVVEKELNAVFHGAESDDAEALPHANRMLKSQKYFITTILNIDGTTYDNGSYLHKDIELIKFSIINVFNEIKSPDGKLIVYNLSNANQMIAILAGNSPKKLSKESQNFLSRLTSALNNLMTISLTIGVSGARPEISREGYNEAHDALSMRILYGVGNIYYYDDTKTLSNTGFPAAQLEMLGAYMHRGDVDNILILLTDIFSRDRVRQFGPEYIRIIWMRVINLVLKSSDDNPYKGFGRLDKSIFNFEIIDNFNYIEDLVQYLYTIILDFINPGSLSDMKCRNKIKLATQYIEENYNTDLAVNDLAYRFAMSPNYFSSLFKKENNTTVVNYIKLLRLKKSRDLLRRSNLSVAEIALAVGYTDHQYFFRVFKKETGITPLQYRNSANSPMAR